MHRLQTEWRILVFGFTTDCHTLQAIVASQQQEMSSGEVPLQKSFVQMQLLPRKLTPTGMLSVRMGWKAQQLLGYTSLPCVQTNAASQYLKDLSVLDSSELDLQGRVTQLCAALLSSAWNCSVLVSMHFSFSVRISLCNMQLKVILKYFGLIVFLFLTPMLLCLKAPLVSITKRE